MQFLKSPRKHGQLSTFASYAKCNEEEVNIKGNEVYEESKKYLVEKNDIYYFSPSGNYKIEIELVIQIFKNPCSC